MRTQAGRRADSLRRGLPALAVIAAVTAAGGAAAAATAPGHAAPAHRAGLSAAGVISTVAGGVGGPAKATKVALGNRFGNAGVCGVWFARGSLYVADGFAVRNVNPQTDRLTTPAGTNSPGQIFPRGLATRASLATCGVTVDAAGNLVIVDIEHRRVVVVAAATGRFYGRAMAQGHIYSVAGGGKSLGDGVPATSASLAFNDAEVAVDAAGNVLIDDGSRVRAVAAATGTFYGQAMTAGNIYTIAGGGTGGLGDGGPATSAELSQPQGLALDAAGNVLIGDTGNNRVRVVAESTGTLYGQAMTAGDIYTIAGNGTAGFSGDGGPAINAELGNTDGRGLPLAVDAAGNVLIADTENNRIRVVAESTGTLYGRAMTAGDIYTIAGNGTPGFAGDGGPATGAELSNPRGITVDAAGNVLIADWFNARVREVAAGTGTSYGRPVTAGDIYTIAGNGSVAYSGDRGIATRAQLNFPQGAAVDSAGNLLIADTDNQRIRAVAARTGTFYGKAMTAGNIYTIAGNGIGGLSGELSEPEGLALDTAGNLLIADTDHDRIAVLAENTGTFFGRAMTAGHIYTIASVSLPSGVAADSHGNAVIADTNSHRVRVVADTTGTFYGQSMTAGNIYTIAGNGTRGFSGDGGPATSAELSFPQGAASDSAGNVLIADTFNLRIRVLAASTGTFYGQAMTAGNIYTIAGGGTGGLGDGGPATSARLSNPPSVTSDSAGNLLIADLGNERIRVAAASTGTFYGQAMTAGDIYTIAGNGHLGFSGDGGPATGAEFNFPRMAFTTGGNLFIVDELNNRIRMVTEPASAIGPLSPRPVRPGHRGTAPR